MLPIPPCPSPATFSSSVTVTLGSSNEVTVLRNLPTPCSNPDFGPQVANFLFLLRRRRVAHSHLPLCTSA